MFHLVSHHFHCTWRFVFLFACVLLGGFLFCFCSVLGLLCFSSEISAFNSRFNSFEFPLQNLRETCRRLSNIVVKLECVGLQVKRTNALLWLCPASCIIRLEERLPSFWTSGLERMNSHVIFKNDQHIWSTKFCY